MMTTPDYDQELNQLLAEDVQHALKREQTTFDEISAPHERELVLFGAGGLGRKTLRGLRQVGIEPLALTDNNPELWGQSIDGIKVVSPQQALADYSGKAAFVSTIWNNNVEHFADRKKQLEGMGFKKVIPFGILFWKYPQIFLPYYSIDLPHHVLEQAEVIRRTFDLFTDAASQDVFIAQLRFRLFMDFEHLPFPVDPPIYFPYDLVRSSSDDCFIDVGAFDGDTIAEYIRLHPMGFRKIIAYEPDPRSYAKLTQYVSGLPDGIKNKISCFRYGLDEVRQQVSFDAQGTESSSIGSGKDVIECFPLDEVLVDRPTQIKMDIEGYEINALRGARQIIAGAFPRLSICVYHRQNHLWDIPDLIASMHSNYHYYLRPHRVDAWDVVLYALPGDEPL
jgi:FkbM family methyltransferase